MQLSVVTRFTYPLPELEARIRAARGDQKSIDSWLNACRTAAKEIGHNIRFSIDLNSAMSDNEITAIFM
ncbi:MAG: hypothetical protein BWY49_00109 [Candidatus Omnitrophica bacterium ADurb.Bin314]|nr:MAG: hypothetical protein BWY49_00109 [Candidatus Omnitrophica bacterium ADurb.Bin314]